MHLYPRPGPSADVIDLVTRQRTITVDQHDVQDWTVVRVDGEMDILAVPLLPDLRGMTAPHVAVMLGGVTFMDASALGDLVRMQREALASGGCVRLVAPSGPVRRLLLLTRTACVFGVYERLEEAFAAPVPTGPERGGHLRRVPRRASR